MIIMLAANGTLSRIISILFLVFMMSGLTVDFYLSSFFDKFATKAVPLSKHSPHCQ